MRNQILIILLLAFNFVITNNKIFAQKYTLSGFIEDKENGEKLIGANIYNPKTFKGTTSNSSGFYSLTLDADTYQLSVSYVGYQNFNFTVILNENIAADIYLSPSIELQEVKVIATEIDTVKEELLSIEKITISIHDIKSMPSLLGETDVLKTIQLLPGVQSGGEGSTGLYVRGGGPDQNLILLDGTPIYNASHLFGFYSVFNDDVVKNIELIKEGFPARYGGRLSSVIEINLKEGNKQQYSASGNAGIISAGFTIEGPIIKEKTSFIASGRRTYIDALSRPIINTFGDDRAFGGYYFYDLNAKISHEFSKKSQLMFSLYSGFDNFYLDTKEEVEGTSANIEYRSNFIINWGNQVASLRWSQIISPKLHSNISMNYSDYQFSTAIQNYVYHVDADTTSTAFTLSYLSGIEDLTVKIDLDYIPSPDHFIKFGLSETYHTFNTGASQQVLTIASTNLLDTMQETELYYGHEIIAYIEDDIKIKSNIKLNIGIHSSLFMINDTLYPSIQPRILFRYYLGQNWLLKASFATMTQYIHLLSNSNVGLPSDLWVPTTKLTPPENSQQYTLGITKKIIGVGLDVSLEGYYKNMNNIIDYVAGANFLDTETDWQNKIESGNGWAYGGEAMLQKKKGKLTGWIGYTLSWSMRKFKNINFGEIYPYKYDRRHDISVVSIYKLNKTVTLSLNWVYGTGNAITMPKAIYWEYDNNLGFSSSEELIYYGSKNSYRMAPYHRLDIACNFTKNKKWGERVWSLGIYNLYSRKNPYFIYLKESEEEIIASQVSIFPILPSISYSFIFK